MTYKPLIAIVEDDASLRCALVTLVRSLGYRAEGHAAGCALLRSMESAPVDLVATDVQMDGMDGFELLGRLRDRWPAVPIIMLTACNDANLPCRATDSGALCLLRKPLVTDELIRWIDAGLHRGRAHPL